MSTAGRGRRTLAEVSWGDDPGAIVWVGARPIHRYWPLLAPYFRDVLLAPQRRAEEEVVAWSWIGGADDRPPSAPELAAVRQRLGKEQQLFAESMAREGRGNEEHGELRRQAVDDQLASAMGSWISSVVKKSDAELAVFVCLTDLGLRMHSWGTWAAARPFSADAREREVRGVVLVDDEPAHGIKIELTSAGGRRIGATRTDAAGKFSFKNVAAGRHRLRATSETAVFPDGGVEVVVERESITDLELRGTTEAKRSTSVVANSGPRSGTAARRKWLAGIAALLLLGLAGGFWAWTRLSSADRVAGKSMNGSGDTTAGAAASRRGEPETNAKAGDSRLFALRPDAAPGGAESGNPAPQDADPAKSVSGSRVPSLGKDIRGPLQSVAGNPAVGDVGRTAPVGVAVEEVAKELPQPADPSLPPGINGNPLGGGTLPGGETGAPVSGAGPASGGSPAAAASPGTGYEGAPGSATEALAGPNPGGNRTSTPPPKRRASAVAPTSEVDPARTADPGMAPRDPAAVSRVDAVAVTAQEPTPANKTMPEAREAARRGLQNQTEMRPTPEDEAQPKDAPASRRANRPSRGAAVTTASSLATTAGTSGEEPSTRGQGTSRTGPATTGLISAESQSASSRWLRTVEVRVLPWQLRLMGDVIVPTRPEPVGGRDTVERLREELRREQATRVPAVFRTPRIMQGFAIDLPPVAPGEPLQWHQESGPAGVISRVGEGRATLRWPTEETPVGAVHELRPTAGDWAVRVTVAADGESRIEVAGDVRVGLFIAIGGAAPAAEQPVARGPRFRWQMGSGQSLPPTWIQTTHGSAADGLNLEVPCAEGTGNRVHRLALVEAGSGWGLVGEISLNAKDSAR